MVPTPFIKGIPQPRFARTLHEHGNPLDAQDLAEYRPRWLEPRVVPYRDDYQLVFGPSTGGSTAVETLNMLEGFDFGGLSPFSAEALHLFIEAGRVAYADRWAHLADEAFVDVPWQVLESKAYAAERRAAIDLQHAASEVHAWQSGAASVGRPEPSGGCTTHLSVVDGERNMVSITQTINMVWGSGVVAPGTGVLLNDTMVLFDPIPGHANSIAGGKRPLSSMTPMLVLRGGKPLMTIGAPGGRMIMGTVMKVIHNVLDFGMGIQAACDNVLVDSSGGTVLADAMLDAAVVQALVEKGHTVNVREKAFLPRLFASPTGILVDAETGDLHGGADSYHPGIAAGY